MSKKSNNIKIESIKPRNHLVALAMTRKAGSHKKSIKATRRADRVWLAKNQCF